MTEIKNPALLEELRVTIRNGGSAIDSIRLLLQRLELGQESRLVVIAYFQTAFNMKLQDASKLGAWDFFPGGTWPDNVINSEITQILRNACESTSERS